MSMQSAKAQIQAVPHVNTTLCLACSRCKARAACRSKALLQLESGDTPFVDASRCYGCHLCLPACPMGALQRSPN